VLPCEVVLEGALGGAGDTVPPMLTSTFFSALRVPVAAWAAARWGTSGIWWTITLTAIGRSLGMALLWRWGRWQRKSL
jgi:Na+-driven multidrug efflux pump